jgi:predicted amidophosphoribosyltransferase
MATRAGVRNLFGDLLDTISPARCPGCGRRAGAIVCDTCAATLAPPPFAAPPPPVAWWTACCAYEGVARELVARAKYRGERRFLVLVASELARALDSAPRFDLVTWAPASAPRIRAQGVDHGEVLARTVAALMGVDVRPLLRRGPGAA